MSRLRASPPPLWMVGTGVVVAVTTLIAVLVPAKWSQSLDFSNVAFIGNSIMFVNDLPRFMVSLSEYRLEQNSCLHGSLSFKSILWKGNGMNNKWRTKNAEISGVDRVYDFGACTVRQLLMGYDEYLVEHNDNGYYIEDGRNPCFQSERYLQYLQFKNIIYLPRFNDDGSMTRVIPRWNYVVINDQTKRPAIPDKLNASAATLRDYYVPYFLESGATPILLSTYGYFSNFTNMTGLGNISMFTFRVHQGYEYYAQVLEENLPSNQRPRIAPVGMAFLVLYEEYRSLWQKLFFIDGYHPSPHGTYLMGCVLYATIFQRMPRKSYYGSSPSALFKRARRMQIGKAQQHVMPFPTKDEANYLYRLAQRVVIDGYRPKSWRKYLRNEENYG